jgi:hypothetical protein
MRISGYLDALRDIHGYSTASHTSDKGAEVLSRYGNEAAQGHVLHQRRCLASRYAMGGSSGKGSLYSEINGADHRLAYHSSHARDLFRRQRSCSGMHFADKRFHT